MPSDATRLKRALTSWAGAVTAEANDRTRDLVRQDAPRVTGELARSIETVPVRKVGDAFQGGLVATTIQAATTDKGARPHQIRPRKAGGRLRFVVDGRTVYAKVVNHPGNKPQRWWKASLERRWPRALRAAARGRKL